MNALIRGGEIVTARDKFVADIVVEDGKIAAIGKNLPAPKGGEIIEAAGRYVIPGGIDVHTHIDMPFMGTTTCDDFETGHIAALAGGTTAHVDFVIPDRGQNLVEALEIWQGKARKACMDYAFHMAIVGWGPNTKKEMAEVVARGVTSFKCFFSYKGALDVDDAQFLEVMRTAKDLGALVTIHCENSEIVASLQQQLVAAGKTAPKYHYDSRPPQVEGEGTARAINIAGLAGDAPLYIVHLTCRDALEPMARARSMGRRVYAETCIQYFLLDRSLYDSESFDVSKWILSPPLRDKGDQEALWIAIRNGDLQVVSTDHAPFRFKDQKVMGREKFTMIPNGIPAIEERMKLLYTYGVVEGRIDMNRFVEVACTNPARMFGLYPRKGTIAIGADADLVVWKKDGESTISAETHHMKSDYSAFEGFKTVGGAETVLLRGSVVWRKGAFCGKKGGGQYLPRKPFEPAVYRR